MRIGLVCFEHPELGSSGGVWAYTHTLAEGLQAIGNEVFILFPSQRIISKPETSVPVRSIATGSILRWTPFPLGRGPGIALANEILRSCRELNIDVLEVPECPGLGSMMATRKPSNLAVVVRVHGPNAILRANKQKGIRTSLRDGLLDVFVRRSLLAADAISVPSAIVWEDLQSQFKIRRDDFSVLPCPVAPGFFRPGSVGTSQPMILCVGRLGWVKGDDVLIRAAPQVLDRFPDVTLRFAGESHDTESVAMHSRLPDPIAKRIEFLGQVKRNEILKLLECARVCVFPSRWESFGIACAEAMAAERPVVVSDAPGFAALVSNEVTGLLVRRGDSEALANAICRLLDSEDLRQKIAVAGRRHVQDLCEQTAVARKAMEMYSTALRRGRSTAQPQKANDAE